MPAGTAGVFAEAAARADERDPVPEQHAGDRVTNQLPPSRLVHEAVSAVARVLHRSTITLGHGVHAVSQQAAQVTDFFRKAGQAAGRVGVAPEQQRMAAANAGVHGMSVAPYHFPIRVMAQEARESVTDAHARPIVGEHGGGATRAPAGIVGKPVVVYRMSPDRAPHATRHRHPPVQRKVQVASETAHSLEGDSGNGIGPAPSMVSLTGESARSAQSATGRSRSRRECRIP